MTPRRILGDILRDSGRVTESDIERALEHQRTHGGYFGEAVIELGILRREEIDWALASQFDLPFVFPDADSADLNATRLVSAEWALAHLAVPIVHAGDRVTVVVADPLDNDTLDELRARTGLDVEMALASASRIRELIRAIYGAPGPPRAAAEGQRARVGLADFLTEALAHGADRIGVSVRGTSALGWYSVGDARVRQPLDDGWDDVLDALLEPSPIEAAREAGGAVTEFEATLHHGGADVAAAAQVMSSLSGTELLLRPRRALAMPASDVGLPESVRADLRLLAADGHARIGVADGAQDVLPQLPALVLGDAARAAHITLDVDVPGVYTLRLEGDVDLADVIEAYDFDALSVDLPLDDARLARILGAAPISFARVAGGDDVATLEDAGINWILSASADRDGPGWKLRPVKR